MSWVLTDSQNYTNIADAINERLDDNRKYYPSEMPAAIRSITGGDIDNPRTYNVMNDVAKAFLEDTTYASETYDDSSTSSINFSTSVMESRYRLEAILAAEDDIRTDEPNELVVDLRNSGTLSIIDNNHIYKDAMVSGTHIINNLTPYSNSHYFNENDSTIKQCGLISPTGQIRMLHTTTTYSSFHSANIRDIGGWACDGGSIAYGKIFRGNRFNGGSVVASNADKKTFHDLLGIRDEIDLRNSSEVTGITESAFGSDIEYHHFELPSNSASYVRDMNSSIYGDVFKQIAYDLQYNNPMYIHCVAGCDRTGIICALLEGLCGVARYNIDKDYELSSLVNFLTSSNEATSEFVRYRTGATWKNWIVALNNNYAGQTFRDKIVSYLCNVGVSIDELNIIRNNLIDGNPEIITVPGYQVSYNLTNATSSNSTSIVTTGGSYTTTITPSTGYNISSIMVTMNDVDVTTSCVSGNIITINSVIGNVVITVNTVVVSYNVTNNLSYCTSNNGAVSVGYGQRYLATITPNAGYQISNNDVTVLMGGVDITSTVTSIDSGNVIINIEPVTNAIVITVDAQPETNVYTITLTLNNHANSSNQSLTVSEGTSYETIITPKTGYYFDSSSAVTCTMGGDTVSVSIPASGDNAGKGIISIASVTGNIVITANPAHSNILVSPFFAHNKLYEPIGFSRNYRLNSTGNPTSSNANGFILVGASNQRGYIPIADNYKITLSNIDTLTHTALTGNYIYYCDSNKNGIQYIDNDDNTLHAGSSFALRLGHIEGFYSNVESGNDYLYTVTLGEYRTSNFTYHTDGYSDGTITLNPAEFTCMSFKAIDSSTDPELYLSE